MTRSVRLAGLIRHVDLGADNPLLALASNHRILNEFGFNHKDVYLTFGSLQDETILLFELGDQNIRAIISVFEIKVVLVRERGLVKYRYPGPVWQGFR